jgi:hypothetical protein
MPKINDLRGRRFLLPAALAAWLFMPGLLAAQQAATLYVRFDFDKSLQDIRFSTERSATEDDLSKKLLRICDSELSIWSFQATNDRYPRLHMWLEETAAELRLHIDLDSDPRALRKPVEVQNRSIWTFGPDDLSAAQLEKKILDTLREELRTEDNWSRFLDRIKAKAPIGKLGNQPLRAINDNGIIRGELPLDYQRCRRVAASQFVLLCDDPRGQLQRVFCLGGGKTKLTAVGPWSMRIFFQKWEAQDVGPAALSGLQALKARSVFLDTYRPNTLEDDEESGGLEIASLAGSTGGPQP